MRIKNLVSLLVVAAIVSVSAGCKSQGHRKVTFTPFGNNFVFEDQTYANENGDLVYKTGFDPESIALFQWLTGKDKVTENGDIEVAEDGVNPTPQPSGEPDP